MPRLLIVTTVPSTLCAFLIPFARHFRSRGWRVDAAAAPGERWNACASAFDHTWQIPWSRNPFDPHHLLHVARLVRTIVECEVYDLVHVHTPVASFITRYALRNRRRPGNPVVIYTAHGFHFYRGGPALRNLAFLSLEQIAGRWTDYLIVINREDEQAARRRGIVSPGRLCYMPGIGIDQSYYDPQAVAASEVTHIRSELQLRTTERYFLMIAEFIPRKRHRDALAAFAALHRTDVHLVFAGTGPLCAIVQKLAYEIGIEDRVHFLGRRSDIPALIKGASATLLPSQQEGLPRSVMESLSLATPVIGTKIRGTSDLLGQGSGLLVEVGDVPGLVQAMAWILANPARAAALGQQGRAQVQAYDVRRIIALHEKLYSRALDGTVWQSPAVDHTQPVAAHSHNRDYCTFQPD